LDALEDRWLPSTLTVTSLADSGPGTLRAAIQTADASQSGNFTIDFAVTGKIDLQSVLPDLANNISINGPGASSLTVERAASASSNFGIFCVDWRQTVSLSGLTVANGTEGGIGNDGTLSVSNCTVTGNSDFVFEAGGGIDNAPAAALTVSDCIISNNPGEFGGGIFNQGTMTVTDSAVSGNSATAQGGGIWNSGLATVSGTTISGNSAPSGGGILTLGVVANTGAESRMTVSDSTISSNSATYGGGIYTGAMLTVTDNSTITCNSATYGGGIFNTNFFNGFVSSVMMRDSTLTDNHATQGAGIYNGASTTLDVLGNSTLSGNIASDSGGGIYNLGTATVEESTLSGNKAGSAGGGIYNGTSGTLTLKHSTVLNNVAPLGADIYNLGALTLVGGTVGVVGP
jgi:predicted outer membrane repeat protein